MVKMCDMAEPSFSLIKFQHTVTIAAYPVIKIQHSGEGEGGRVVTLFGLRQSAWKKGILVPASLIFLQVRLKFVPPHIRTPSLLPMPLSKLRDVVTYCSSRSRGDHVKHCAVKVLPCRAMFLQVLLKSAAVAGLVVAIAISKVANEQIIVLLLMLKIFCIVGIPFCIKRLQHHMVETSD
jgi:hypothetical protein